MEERWVYFVTDGDAIKIGFSVYAPGRADGLQTGNPRELKVIGYFRGSRKNERDLQKKFEHLRVRREWFRPEPDLLNYIESLRAEGKLFCEKPKAAPSATPTPKLIDPRAAVRKAVWGLWRNECNPFIRSRLRTIHQNLCGRDSPQLRSLLAASLSDLERYRSLGHDRYLAQMMPSSH